jgi:hypothetical protein
VPGAGAQRGRILSTASLQRRQGTGVLKDDYANIITKTFRFPVGTGNGRTVSSPDKQLIVHEYLAESRLTYSLPVQLLLVMRYCFIYLFIYLFIIYSFILRIGKILCRI